MVIYILVYWMEKEIVGVFLLIVYLYKFKIFVLIDWMIK